MAGRNLTSPHDKFFHSIMERHAVAVHWPLDNPVGGELLKLLLNYMLLVGNIEDIPGFLNEIDRLSGPIRSEVMTFAEQIEKQGKLEGIREGKREGIQEGIRKGMQAVALRMLKGGAETAFIAKMTELSESDIECLRASLNENEN